jgi:hypothetical protein
MTTLARGASSHFMTSISGTAENGVRRGPSPAGHAVRLQLRASAAQNLPAKFSGFIPTTQCAVIRKRQQSHHGVTVPLMIIMDIAIRSGSPGPVFGRESCIGRRGRRFQMLQFRKTVAHEPDKPSGPRSRNLPASARSFATPVLTACRSSSMCYRGDEHR